MIEKELQQLGEPRWSKTDASRKTLLLPYVPAGIMELKRRTHIIVIKVVN